MPSESGFFTPPNLLTLSRIPLARLVWFDLKRREYILLVMGVAAITDLLDGWLARRLSLHHPAGVWLDPVCDKIFVISVLGALTVAQHVPFYIPLMIASREVIQVPLVPVYFDQLILKQKRINVESAPIGKFATSMQFLAIGALLLRSRWALPLAALAGIAGSAAATFYIRRTFEQLREPHAVNGAESLWRKGA